MIGNDQIIPHASAHVCMGKRHIWGLMEGNVNVDSQIDFYGSETILAGMVC